LGNAVGRGVDVGRLAGIVLGDQGMPDPLLPVIWSISGKVSPAV
jgi:hypothetical protein